MRTRERSEHKITGIRMPWMHLKLGRLFDAIYNCSKIRQLQTWMNTLAIKVQRHTNQINITCSPTLEKYAPCVSWCTRHKSEFCCCNCGPTIIVGVYAQYQSLAVFDSSMYPLNLIGINIRCA